MNGIAAALALAALATSPAALLAAAPSAPTAAVPAGLAGFYDGGQMEMAAALELGADGTFGYALSYGALDEQAEGRWAVEQGRVVLHETRFLTNDPARPPFGAVSLTIQDGVLLLQRHDRTLRFRRD